MDFHDSDDRPPLPQPAEPPAPAVETAPGSAPAVETAPGSAAALVSVICGIAACVLNLFLITAPLGLLFGIIGLVGGLIARRSGGSGRAGLVLAFVSLIILLVYAASALVPLLADPTARLRR